MFQPGEQRGTIFELKLMRKLYRSDIAQIVLQETRTDVVRRGNATEWIECLDSIPLPREGATKDRPLSKRAQAGRPVGRQNDLDVRAVPVAVGNKVVNEHHLLDLPFPTVRTTHFIRRCALLAVEAHICGEGQLALSWLAEILGAVEPDPPLSAINHNARVDERYSK